MPQTYSLTMRPSPQYEKHQNSRRLHPNLYFNIIIKKIGNAAFRRHVVTAFVFSAQYPSPAAMLCL